MNRFFPLRVNGRVLPSSPRSPSRSCNALHGQAMIEKG